MFDPGKMKRRLLGNDRAECEEDKDIRKKSRGAERDAD